MTPQNCKILLERGILQAFAEGKVIEAHQLHTDDWIPSLVKTGELQFNMPPDCYRIKPEPLFKVGDLVRVPNHEGACRVTKVNDRGAAVRASIEGSEPTWYDNKDVTLLKEVRTPYTFMDLIKAISNHGLQIKDIDGVFTISVLTQTEVTIYNRHNNYWIQSLAQLTSYSFLDGTPCCNITYEDVT